MPNTASLANKVSEKSPHAGRRLVGGYTIVQIGCQTARPPGARREEEAGRRPQPRQRADERRLRRAAAGRVPGGEGVGSDLLFDTHTFIWWADEPEMLWPRYKMTTTGWC